MPVSPSPKPIMSEDWAVVAIGFVIIIFSLLLIVIPVPSFSWSSFSDLNKVLGSSNLVRMALQLAAVMIAGTATAALIGKSAVQFMKMFPLVAGITLLALLFAGNAAVKGLNLEAVIFSLVLGLVVGNLFNLPTWVREALSTETFVKIGLVLLGTGVLFSDILKAGLLGLLQALVVVISVWYFAYWVCRKFKLDEELSMMLSSAVSICGVSAAIATAGAIKGDEAKRKQSR